VVAETAEVGWIKPRTGIVRAKLEASLLPSASFSGWSKLLVCLAIAKQAAGTATEIPHPKSSRSISSDNAGTGVALVNSGGVAVAGSDDNTRSNGRDYLGGGKYLEYFKTTGHASFDEFTVKTNYNHGDEVYIEAIHYFNEGDVSFEFSSVSVSLDKLTSKGISSFFTGNDKIIGNSYSDILHGFTGNDKIIGGAGTDRVFGDSGSDHLSGGSGSDRLSGGVASDYLCGGAGADRFVFSRGAGRDLVTDFQDGLDQIEIATGAERFADIRIQQRGHDTVLTFADVSVTLEDVNRHQITANDFIFV
jgi:Ca2+-binding RTX toxin-like protein